MSMDRHARLTPLRVPYATSKPPTNLTATFPLRAGTLSATLVLRACQGCGDVAVIWLLPLPSPCRYVAVLDRRPWGYLGVHQSVTVGVMLGSIQGVPWYYLGIEMHDNIL